MNQENPSIGKETIFVKRYKSGKLEWGHSKFGRMVTDDIKYVIRFMDVHNFNYTIIDTDKKEEDND